MPWCRPAARACREKSLRYRVRMTVVVRRAVVGDTRTIATIRIETWRVAYDGLIAAALLDSLDSERETERRSLHWDEHHADPRIADFIAEVDGHPVGWAAVGPSREVAGAGEVYAIYALPAH